MKDCLGRSFSSVCGTGSEDLSTKSTKTAQERSLTGSGRSGRMTAMSKLAEIEQAADSLPPEQKQELMLFLAARLRAGGARMPEPRQYSREQIETWLSEDEAQLRQFKREG